MQHYFDSFFDNLLDPKVLIKRSKMLDTYESVKKMMGRVAEINGYMEDVDGLKSKMENLTFRSSNLNAIQCVMDRN